jgi:hypothetical protein
VRAVMVQRVIAVLWDQPLPTNKRLQKSLTHHIIPGLYHWVGASLLSRTRIWAAIFSPMTGGVSAPT